MSVAGVTDCACADVTSLGGRPVWLRGRSSIPRALEILRTDAARVVTAMADSDPAQPVEARYSRSVHVDGLHVLAVFASDDGRGAAVWP